MTQPGIQPYQAAISEQFPALHVDTIAYLGEAKDHVGCLVNGQLVFRFPKREEAEQKLRMELALLPELAPTLPLPIPQYSHIARTPSRAFSRIFAGYPLLAGEPLTNYIPAIWDMPWWAPAVGAFVTALHRFPVARARQLGVPGSTPEEWRSRYQNLYSGVQEKVWPLVTRRQRAAIRRYFADFLDNPRHFEWEPVLLHHDIYSGHILLEVATQQVTGIIDFSDCDIGDPAVDVRNAWEPYYGGTMDATWPERRAFYYQLQPLAEVVAAEVLRDVYPALVAQALEQIKRRWPA
ncbi:MAG TPA: phosphotransferase [Chloroflexia bacterium]|jgi:aminoglycoside 2''-phosphotransferase|nr:phosphotransferase [Chloroflexia bacterium]